MNQKRIEMLGESWAKLVGGEFNLSYMKDLGKFIAIRRTRSTIYPSKEDTFRAYRLAAYLDAKVVMVGQDPYNNGAACGLVYGKKKGFKGKTWLPASLEVILKAIEKDIPSCFSPAFAGDLSCWAKQGVLLINPILTVEHGKPSSHADIGWERFTTRVIDVLDRHPDRLVFLLWGKYAKSYKSKISSRHYVIEAAHPASALYQGTEWNSNQSFKKTNEFLKATNREPINW